MTTILLILAWVFGYFIVGFIAIILSLKAACLICGSDNVEAEMPEVLEFETVAVGTIFWPIAAPALFFATLGVVSTQGKLFQKIMNWVKK